MAGWQNDPIVSGPQAAAPPAAASKGGSWQNDPMVGGGGGAPTANVPSDNDYSNSPLSALGRTFESSADWGVGDLLRAAATGKRPSETAAQSSAAAASLPWYVRYPTEAAGYGLGLVNLLDPVTDAAEAGAGMLGAGATLSKIAGGAAEGATVGGVHHIASSNDPGLTDTGWAALGGAGVGAAAGGIGIGANKALTGLTGKAPSIDPDLAVANTAATKTAKYAATKAIAHDPNDIADAYFNTQLAPSHTISPGFQGMINQQQKAIYNGGNSVDDIARYAQDLRSAADAPGATTGDQVAAGQIANKLVGENGILNTAQPISQGHAIGDGYNALQEANTANTQWEMAKNLKTWQQQIAAGGSVGSAPLTEAQTYFPNDPARFQALSGIANQGGADHGLGYMLGHLAAHALGIGGYAVGGIPGSLLGEALGLGVVRPAVFKAMKGAGQKGKLADVQALYPQMTGQQLSPGSPGLQIGDSIKNLMLGATY